jgi:two-component system, LytTR family, sensor kinase
MRFINKLIYSTHPGIWLIRHVLFWATNIFNWLVVVSFYKELNMEDVYYLLLVIPLAMTATYFIIYYLLPRFSNDLSNAKLFFYILCVLFALGFFLRVYKIHFVYPLLGSAPASGPEWLTFGLIINEVFYWLGAIGMAGTLKLIKGRTELQQRNEMLISEKRIAELSFLKMQMHPHFFFNTLNTLYSETIKNTEKAGQVVMHLSDLFRFILEECDKPVITLEKELKVINDYISLEQLRHGKRLKVNFIVPENTAGITLSPLLFLPFIENSFKHSLANVRGTVTIDIRISVDDDRIRLDVENDSAEALAPTLSTGKGIANIKRQLALLYNKDHELTVHDDTNKYRVALVIPSKPSYRYGEN